MSHSIPRDRQPSPPGVDRGLRRQPMLRVSPVTVTGTGARPVVAGPETGDPSAREKWLAWHVHSIDSAVTRLTAQPAWGQVLVKALKVPATGWVTTYLSSVRMSPPPTGTFDTDSPSDPDPEQPVSSGVPIAAAAIPVPARTPLRLND